MSALQSLKLVNQRRPNALPPVLHRRRKLDTKLWEQIQLAQAQAARPTEAAPAPRSSSMADLPAVKEEAKRLAALMERLQKETDPAERRRIMVETSCAQ